MPLFKTIEEIKSFLPVNVGFNFADILPDIKRVEKKFIIPAIGKEQYNDLNDEYNEETPSLSAEQTALLLNLRPAIINLAYYFYIPKGQVQVSSSGIHITSTENKKTAFEWQIRELKSSYRDTGYEALDDCLAFMEENKDDYDLWTASDAYTVFKENFINTIDELCTLVPSLKNSRRTFLAMKPIFKKVEDFYIKSVTCKPLFDEIKAQILAGTVSELNQELLDLIKPGVAHMAVALSITDLGLQISEDGVLTYSNPSFKTIDALSNASMNAIATIKNARETDANVYFKNLRDALYADPESYPLFSDSTCYVANSTDTFDNSTSNKFFSSI